MGKCTHLPVRNYQWLTHGQEYLPMPPRVFRQCLVTFPFHGPNLFTSATAAIQFFLPLFTILFSILADTA